MTVAPLDLDQMRARARDRGMNLVGAVDARAFDETQSSCRRSSSWLAGADTVILFGSGGRAGFEGVLRSRGGQIGSPSVHHHPIDDWSRRLAEDELEILRRAGCEGRIVAPDDRHSLNFRQLGELVGFGTISPVIGHLLSPEFGPWVSLRVALVVRGRPFGDCPAAPLTDFEPCCSCKRPCVAACPAEVYSRGKIDLMRCGSHRLDGGCETGCASLQACPVGAEHRYGAEEEAFRHRYSLFGLERWFGRGRWRFVPERWRRR